MTHKEKVKFMLSDLKQRGVGKFTSAPLAHRALWTMGLQVKPPLFQSFWTLFLSQGALVGIVWGVAMWFTVWRGTSISGLAVIGSAILFGLLGGGLIAAYCRWKAKRLKLPPWEQYGEA